MTFEEYYQQESPNLLNGDYLLAPEQVMARLKITRKQLYQLHRGEHPRGLHLPVCRLGNKTLRYRLFDVLRLEWAALHGNGKL